ncbi:unnamed protein product [Clonostachys rosea f. rosea IK726]|uniref:Uncharacterized protein n=2 Tax=Bionectria ochroleuca TaxID=29856 RepID=A0A8H7KDN3_BIOOC|nr:unnamed protein product [Clonostachys rosea f. rosea IK726]
MGFTTEEGRAPVTWYRSSIFSALIVAITAFTCPGIFGALNGMGAGGGAKPEVSDAANAVVFAVIALGSPIVGAVCGWLTPKWTLVIGTLGYAPYAAGFFVVDKYGQEWLLLFGSVTCGLSACFLWVASGAIFMGYPEEHRKGLATSLKFMLQNLGASIGGIISLALNVTRNYRGSISNATYIVMIVIMCIGLPFSLFLPAADRVQRSDGRRVILKKSKSILSEFKILWALLKQPKVLAMMPMMLYAQWFLAYQWKFNYSYFTVRSRALNSMLFYISGFLASWLLGQFLDWQRFSRKTRARVGFLVLFFSVGASWIIGQAVQVHYAKTTPTLDWAETEYGLGCFVFLLWGASDPIVTTYKYWIAGSLTNNVNEAAFLSALINSIGSVGSTFGFVIGVKKFSLVGACAINLALFFISAPGLGWVAYTGISETSHGTSLTGLADLDDEPPSSYDEADASTDSKDVVTTRVAGVKA